MSQDRTQPTRGRGPMGRGPMGGGPMGYGMMGEKPRNFKGTMRQLALYLKPFWLQVALVIVFAIVSTVFAINAPKLIGDLTDFLAEHAAIKQAYIKIHQGLPQGMQLPEGTTGEKLIQMQVIPQELLDKMPQRMLEQFKSFDFSGQQPKLDYGVLADKAMFLIGLYLLAAIFTYIQGYIMSGVAQKVTYDLRKNISLKLKRLPLKYFDSRTHGEILSRVTNDIDTVGMTLNQSLAQMITSIVSIIGVLIMMLTISWIMTLVVVLVVPLSGVFISIIVKRSQKYFKGQQASLGRINGHVEEMYSGHTVMKAYNGEARSVEQFEKHNRELYGFAWKSQFLSGMMMPIIMFIGNIGYVAVCAVGGYLAVRNTISIGDIITFIQYVRQFTQPITQVANMTNVLQSTAAAAERVFELLAEPEEVPEEAEPVNLGAVKGHVRFKDVVFGYNEDKTIIKGFNAEIRPGQKVAIVGPTGAGKTTMVNLLMRFYDVNSGSIEIDGVDIRKLSRMQLRRTFGMVLQDTWLFNGTIRENIAYGRLGATDEEITAAAKAAHVDHFVHTLPEGYNMVLNEEASNISAGQKQLLTIARAVLADPAILILDEATSSVDTRTEILIQRAMESLMQGRTSFVIAHRLSTIRNADLILVMRDGNIAEQGKHEELLSKGGFYAELYNSQFEKASA